MFKRVSTFFLMNISTKSRRRLLIFLICLFLLISIYFFKVKGAQRANVLTASQTEPRNRPINSETQAKNHLINASTRTDYDDLISTTQLKLRSFFHPGCNCSRLGYDIEGLQKARREALRDPHTQPAWFLDRYPDDFTSTCSDYATQRGVGQRVVSYSYYVPTGIAEEGSRPVLKFLKQMYPRAQRIAEAYPGWIMRVYHNVTPADALSTRHFCRVFCDFEHVDLCNVRDLPKLGNLASRMPIGRTWRFAALGDPSVSWMMSRDLDSDILDREVSAVEAWWQSGKHFHLMRDHPLHDAVVLAGLWGAFIERPDDYRQLRDLMFAQPVSYDKYFDQTLLARFLWPFMQGDVLQHMSYNCRSYPGSVPFPTQRVDGYYCGWGPFTVGERQLVIQHKCPQECRPKEHPQWAWC